MIYSRNNWCAVSEFRRQNYFGDKIRCIIFVCSFVHRTSVFIRLFEPWSRARISVNLAHVRVQSCGPTANTKAAVVWADSLMWSVTDDVKHIFQLTHSPNQSSSDANLPSWKSTRSPASLEVESGMFVCPLDVHEDYLQFERRMMENHSHEKRRVAVANSQTNCDFKAY